MDRKHIEEKIFSKINSYSNTEKFDRNYNTLFDVFSFQVRFSSGKTKLN